MDQTMEVRILEGASILFYKYGFSRVRFSEIAREIGITTRTIYNYYPNKKSLSKAVSEYTIKLVLEDIRVIAEGDTSYSETIYLILKQVYQELETRLPAYWKDAELPGNGLPHLTDVDPDIEALINQLTSRGVKENIFEKNASLEVMIQIILTQVNYCFPADGAHSAVSVDEDYFINSILLILTICTTDEGRRQIRQFIK